MANGQFFQEMLGHSYVVSSFTSMCLPWQMHPGNSPMRNLFTGVAEKIIVSAVIFNFWLHLVSFS